MRFYEALEQTMNGISFIKRKVVKNDTAIAPYKNRLYQYCTSTMIRYPYSPTNKDIFADDWEVLTPDEVKELSKCNEPLK